MFDIGFSELFVIGIVALVVLGPERLPKAARFAGLWVRRARAQWYSVKSELERELAADELKRSLHDGRRTVADIDADLRSTEQDLRREFDSMRGAVAGSGSGTDAVEAEQPEFEASQSIARPVAHDDSGASPARSDTPQRESADVRR
jgi:sec-independent protein translocase protein TatB